MNLRRNTAQQEANNDDHESSRSCRSAETGGPIHTQKKQTVVLSALQLWPAAVTVRPPDARRNASLCSEEGRAWKSKPKSKRGRTMDRRWRRRRMGLPADRTDPSCSSSRRAHVPSLARFLSFDEDVLPATVRPVPQLVAVLQASY